jgi:hypothetical protein
MIVRMELGMSRTLLVQDMEEHILQIETSKASAADPNHGVRIQRDVGQANQGKERLASHQAQKHTIKCWSSKDDSKNDSSAVPFSSRLIKGFSHYFLQALLGISKSDDFRWFHREGSVVGNQLVFFLRFIRMGFDNQQVTWAAFFHFIGPRGP